MDKYMAMVKKELKGFPPDEDVTVSGSKEKDYDALFLERISEYDLDRSDFTDEEYAEAIKELKDEDAGM